MPELVNSADSAAFVEALKAKKITKPLVIDKSMSLYDDASCQTFTEVIVTDKANPYVVGVRMRVNHDKIAEIVADVLQPPSENRAFQDPPVIEVSNGTSRPDLDLLAADNLAWEGLIPVLGQADRHDYTETQVIYFGSSFKGANAWTITKLFGVYQSEIVLQPDPTSAVDYRVILGYNYEPCVHKVAAAAAAPTVTPTPVWTPPPG